LSQETCQGFKLQFLRRTEALRLNFGSPEPNSHASVLTRSRFLWSAAFATTLATRLSAQQRPHRIVSTAPSITGALFALGLGDQVVGVSRFCDFPVAIQKLPKVGTYRSPDVEAIGRLAHCVLLPRVFLFGGALLAVCDAVGRIALPPAEIPACAVLALIGGPYLVWAIRQRRPSEEI
jgi:FecCD transport family